MNLPALRKRFKTDWPVLSGPAVWLWMLALAVSGCSAAASSSYQPPPQRAYVTKAQLEVPYAIMAGGPESVWFSEYQNNSLSRFTSAGVLKIFPLTGDGFPERLATGPDGAIWFTDTIGNRIGRLAPDGSATFFALPTPRAGPDGISAGPDGGVWFTEHAIDRIGRISSDGKIIEYALPYGSGPAEIIAGADGSLWFTEDYGNQIGRITTVGVIKELRIPTPRSHPGGLALAPGGTIWFAELATG
jgi:virginiamycin B lyase